MDNRGQGIDVDVAASSSTRRSRSTDEDLDVFVGGCRLGPVVPVSVIRGVLKLDRSKIGLPSAKVPVVRVVEVVNATVVVIELDVDSVKANRVDNARWLMRD